MSGKLTKAAQFSVLAISAAAGVLLSGCAGFVVDEATVFADPAIFASYDCKQLATVRTVYAKRVEELQGLMAKAATGTGGSIVSEIAYRPDYVAFQARLKSANAAWVQNRCDVADQSVDPSFARPSPGMEPAAGRSRSRVY